MPEMRKLFNRMDSVKLALQSSRQEALEYFASMNKEPPFAHDVQFPDYKTYAAINQGSYSNLFRQMVTALNFKELNQTREGKERSEVGTRVQLKNGNGGNGNPDERMAVQQQDSEPKDSIPNDVLLSFTTSIQALRNMIGRREKLYSRMSLERELALAWA